VALLGIFLSIGAAVSVLLQKDQWQATKVDRSRRFAVLSVSAADLWTDVKTLVRSYKFALRSDQSQIQSLGNPPFVPWVERPHRTSRDSGEGPNARTRLRVL